MIKGKELVLMVRALSHEKDIPEREIFEAVEKAFATAVRKHYGNEAEIKVKIDTQKGNFDINRLWQIVATADEIIQPDKQMTLQEAEKKFKDQEVKVDAIVEEPLSLLAGEDLGRIAAQIFKQGITENVKKAERLKIVSSYLAKKGKLLTGSAKAVKRDHILLDISGAEACLPREEMLPREAVRVGDKLRVYLYDVHYEPRGPQLFVSRIRPGMLIELFRLEVPEVAEDLIEIRAAARDPGQRAKIAVKTNDGRIDPVGACVGMRGVRVQAISNELGGERVDIILWDDNPAQLVINAMAPAEVLSLMVDEDTHTMDIIVKEEQLSQAIGRNGQNVRLASELTGWTLNVLTEQEAQTKQETEAENVVDLFMSALDIDAEVANLLVNEGFSTLEEVAFVPREELLAIDVLDEEIADELQQRAQNALEAKAQEASEESGPASDLLSLPGMTEEIANRLASLKILTRDDLAELSVDDLLEIDGMSEQQAAELIMAARAHWFHEEEDK